MCCQFEADTKDGGRVTVTAVDRGRVASQYVTTYSVGDTVVEAHTAALDVEQQHGVQLRRASEQRHLKEAGLVPDWSTLRVIDCDLAHGGAA